MTDGRRLAGAAADAAAICRSVREQATLAIAAGIDVIQVREPELAARDLFALANAIVALTRESATRVIINDRLDVALASGAHGVHLRSSSPLPHEIRPRVPGGFLIGRSVHDVQAARMAAGADYLIAGTVWPTASKPPDHGTIGVGGFGEIVRAAAPIPVLAIGGVTLERAPLAVAQGAAGIAAIGLFVPLDEIAGSGLASIVKSLHAMR